MLGASIPDWDGQLSYSFLFSWILAIAQCGTKPQCIPIFLIMTQFVVILRKSYQLYWKRMYLGAHFNRFYVTDKLCRWYYVVDVWEQQLISIKVLNSSAFELYFVSGRKKILDLQLAFLNTTSPFLLLFMLLTKPQHFIWGWGIGSRPHVFWIFCSHFSLHTTDLSSLTYWEDNC